MRKYVLIFLMVAFMIVIAILVNAATFVDDDDTDFTSGNLSVNSMVIGSGASANVTINISSLQNQTENLFGRGIDVNASVVLYLRFEEGTGQYANDSSIYQANNGTLGANNAVASNDPSWNSSTKFENFGLSFNGDDFVNISNSIIDDLDVPLSVEAWIRRSTGGVTGTEAIVNGVLLTWGFYATFGAAGVLGFGERGTSEVLANTGISDTDWHHAAVTYDGTTVNFYLDGALDASRAYSDPDFASGQKAIGISPNSLTEGFNGNIDEVLLWNVTLDAATILEHAQKGWGYFNQSNFTSQTFDSTITIAEWTGISWAQEVPYEKEIGRADGDGTTATDEDGFINTTGLVLLMHFNNETGESERKIGDIYDISQEKDLVLYMPFDTANAKEVNETSVNLSGLVGLWHFNNETGENDSFIKDFSVDVNPERAGEIHNNATCSLEGGTCPTYNSSRKKLGAFAVGFDGREVGYEVAYDNSLNITTLTILAWIYPDDLSTERMILDKRNQFSFRIQSSTKTLTYYDGTAVFTDDGPSPELNQWSHVGMTLTDGTVTFYLNGVPQSSKAANIGPPHDGAMFIGSNNGRTEQFTGLIDEVALWNVSLSSKHIAELSGYGIDKSIYGNNATSMNGSVNFTDSIFGEAWALDGVDDYIEVADDDSLDLTTDGTISVWAKFDILSGTKTLVCRANYGYCFSVYATGKISWGKNGIDEVQSNTALSTGVWYHITGTRSGGINKIYLDGVLDNSGSTDNFQDLATKIVIGSYLGTGNFVDGKIDEFAMWNRSLSADEVSELAGIKVVDYSGFGNNGSRNFNTAPDFGSNFTAGKFGKALEFDGVDDFVNISGDFPLQLVSTDFSISVWAYRDGSDAAAYQVIINIGNPGDSSPELNFRYKDATTHVQWYFQSPDGGLPYSVSNPNDRWIHWGLVYDATTGIRRLYSDGSLVASDTAGSVPSFAANQAVYIGRKMDNSQHFPGFIDELAIFNRSLSQTEIQNLYKRGVLRLNLSYRTSNDSTTFSDWKGVDNNTLSSFSEVARYLEYKAVFNTTDNAYTSVLHNVTVNYSVGKPEMSDTWTYPVNNDVANNTNITFKWGNCTSGGTPPYNFSFYVAKDGEDMDLVFNGSDIGWTSNFTSDGIYNYTYSCLDSNSISSENATLRNFTLDTSLPTATIISQPSNPTTLVVEYFNVTLGDDRALYAYNFTLYNISDPNNIQLLNSTKNTTLSGTKVYINTTIDHSAILGTGFAALRVNITVWDASSAGELNQNSVQIDYNFTSPSIFARQYGEVKWYNGTEINWTVNLIIVNNQSSAITFNITADDGLLPELGSSTQITLQANEIYTRTYENHSTRDDFTTGSDWDLNFTAVALRHSYGYAFSYSNNLSLINPIDPATKSSCGCPSSGIWEIINGNTCYLNSVCNLGSNVARVVNGALRIGDLGKLIANGLFLGDNETLHLDSDAGLAIE